MNLLHILEEVQLRAITICKSNETRMPTPAKIRSRSLGMTQKQRNTAHTAPAFWDAPVQLLTDIPAQENLFIHFFLSAPTGYNFSIQAFKTLTSVT